MTYINQPKKKSRNSIIARAIKFTRVPAYKRGVQFSEFLENRFGAHKAERIIKYGAISVFVCLAVLLALMSYDGLTRERNGLDGSAIRYVPVFSEALWTAMLAIFVIFTLWISTKKQSYVVRWLVRIASLAIICLVWFGFLYGLSWYAKKNFVSELWAVGISVIVIILFIVLIVNTTKRKVRAKRTTRSNSL